MMKLAALLLVVMASSSIAQGFTNTDVAKKLAESTARIVSELSMRVGKTYTLMPYPIANTTGPFECSGYIMNQRIRSEIRMLDKNIYRSPNPVEFTIEKFIVDEKYPAAYSSYQVIINDENKTVGFIGANDLRVIVPTTVSHVLRGCVFDGKKESVAEKINATKKLSKKLKIGMHQDTVTVLTEWGEPDKINTFRTGRIAQDQWVYDNFWKKGFLYFNAQGILTAIQEQ